MRTALIDVILDLGAQRRSGMFQCLRGRRPCLNRCRSFDHTGIASTGIDHIVPNAQWLGVNAWRRSVSIMNTALVIYPLVDACDAGPVDAKRDRRNANNQKKRTHI